MPATKPTVYLETHSQDPAYNLAFEETVLKVRKDRPYLLLWQNDNTIVVGQNQNTAAEIDPDFVEAHHIHVVRSCLSRPGESQLFLFDRCGQCR